MRALLGIAAIVLLLAVCGWITFSWNGNQASVNVETEKIESDTQRIVDEGQDLLDEAGRDAPNRDAVPEDGDGAPTSNVTTTTEEEKPVAPTTIEP